MINRMAGAPVWNLTLGSQGGFLPRHNTGFQYLFRHGPESSFEQST
uniref:Uncharacterized protein n=1 Tax=Pseudomonas aeruginosa TaxID=287 RepID=A0A7S5YCB3_PSEAI|nr:hypothetical protein [Pseudomonas aeruginosa]